VTFLVPACQQQNKGKLSHSMKGEVKSQSGTGNVESTVVFATPKGK
jgi:hypothetical protein